MTHRIVVCDDDAHITRAVSMKLKKGGYLVETCSDGQFGWEAIQREKPAMVITDCQMPRVDGLELSRLIREQPELNDLPIVLLTGKGFELSEEDLRSEIGITKLMVKPFSPRELLKTVQEALEPLVTA